MRWGGYDIGDDLAEFQWMRATLPYAGMRGRMTRKLGCIAKIGGSPRRRERGHPHAMRTHFRVKPFAEAFYPRFCSGINGPAGPRILGADTRDIDNRARSLPTHHRSCPAAPKDHAGEVEAQRAQDLIIRKFRRRRDAARGSCVVD